MEGGIFVSIQKMIYGTKINVQKCLLFKGDICLCREEEGEEERGMPRSFGVVCLFAILFCGGCLGEGGGMGSITEKIGQQAVKAHKNAPKTNEVVVALQRDGVVQSYMKDPASFYELYHNNEALWGDMQVDDAWVNFVRTQVGEIDSARLMLEFGMIPSLQMGGNELHLAAGSGDVTKISEMIKEQEEKEGDCERGGEGGGVVDTPKRDGVNSLMVSAFLGKEEAAKALVEGGADVGARSLHGVTALHIAAAMGQVKMIEILLDGGAEVDSPHPFAGSTPLQFAAEMGQVEAIKKLCERGANPMKTKKYGVTSLHIAAEGGESEVVRALLSSPCGGDPNVLMYGDTTPLYMAAFAGHPKTVQTLLDLGATIDYSMPIGISGSSLTAPKTPEEKEKEKEEQKKKEQEKEKTETKNKENKKEEEEEEEEEESLDNLWDQDLQKFHQQGADPFQEGFEQGNGATALQAAAEGDHPEVVKVLLKAGADMDGPGGMGVSALYIAAEHNALKSAKVLLEWGADPLEAKGNRPTPLSIAVSRGNVEMVKLLASFR